LWPATFTSSATILIKEQDIPPELVRSTVTSYASQRIQAISQRVMARPNLLEIIDKYDLYTDERKRLTTEEIVEEMRENISLDMIDAQVVDPRSGRPTAATIAFRLSFSGEHPGQVQKVANELMSLYLKENLKERSQQASETLTFLSEEADRLRVEIAKSEEKLAAFKEEHADALPGMADLNFKVVERTEDEISEIDNQIRSLEETRSHLSSQLAQTPAYGDDRGDNIMLDPAARLQAMRTEYLRLIARYSEDHPDVVRTRREIKALEQETGLTASSSALQSEKLEELRRELATLRNKYSSDHPDVARLQQQVNTLESSITSTPKPAPSVTPTPTNPAYTQLQSRTEAIGVTIKSLQRKRGALEGKLTDYERRLAEAPQREWEFRTLARELRNATQKYQELRAKEMQARLAQELEKDSKGERFEIVEPPIRPEEPVSPNRPAILFLSLVLALGSGIGFAAVAESMDDSVHGSKSIASTLGAAPLAAIPYFENETEMSKRKRRLATRAAAAVGAVVLVIVALHVFWTPLDVLWYKALRKADVVINT
ncbi:MAG: lipopolysaccharide biosynthesis protein, partial [Gammaproteobacteria bacterium]